MPDNVPVGPTGGGPTSVETVAADDINGAKYQRIKLIHGPDNTNDGDVSKSNPLPVVPKLANLDFKGDQPPPIDSVNTITTSSAIDCTGKSKILLHTEYSDSGGTVPLRVLFLDHNGTIQAEAWSAFATPANSGIQGNTIETNYYHGETIVLDVNGAKEFKIRVNANPSAGNVSVFAAVV